MSASIAVIGGGPAGLAAAIKGSDCGMNVSLFEKGEIGENIKCAEGYFDSMKVFGKPSSGVLYKVNNLLIVGEQEYSIDCTNMN